MSCRITTGVGVELTAFFSSGDGWAQPWVLDIELVESLRFGPPAGHTDLDVAIALTGLLHHDFVSYGTDGQGRHLDDESVPLIIRRTAPSWSAWPSSRPPGRFVPSTDRAGSEPTGAPTG
jgi:hypothetical protein